MTFDAVQVEVDGADAVGDLGLEALEAGRDLLGDRQERDRRGDEARLLRLVDDGAALRPRGELFRRRRIRLLGHRQLLGDAALGALVAVGDLQDQLVLAGVEVAPHRQRDLVGADLRRRDVEPVFEVVDQAVALDDLADHVDVVELLLAELAGLQLASWGQAAREVHADLVGALLGETHELDDAERNGAGGELRRHREDLVHALRLDDGRLEELRGPDHGHRSRPENGRRVGDRLAAPCATRSSA